ncbi:MAG: shikimate kinase AroK [Burkholderiales bacterium]
MTAHADAAIPAAPSIPGNVFLVGLMGAGKSSVGRMLAKRLDKAFVDCDHEIERRTGVGIPVIFDIEGEAGFRVREAALIEELTARDGIVLATGGGAVLDAHNRTLLAGRGCVVYLRAAVDELWRRTRHDRHRPLLRTPDPRARLTELLTAREPLYQEVAHVTVDTGSQSLQALADRIVERLQEHPACKP